MKTFSAMSKDELGNTSLIKLSIDEPRQQGLLEWPPETSTLIKTTVSENREQVLCWIKWPSFNVRCVIASGEVGGRHFLYIHFAGARHSFEIDGADRRAFLAFVNQLAVPVASSTEGDDNTTAQAPDDFLADAELGLTHASLFLAKPFSTNVEMEFLNVVVNGRRINLPPPSPMPGNQGIFIPMGFYSSGGTITIGWEFETRYVRDTTKVLVGIFRNQSIQDRTVLEQLNVEMFKRYSGLSSIKI